MKNDLHPITGEELKRAAMAAKIVRVEHHACAGCNYMTAWIISSEGHLGFDTGCDCTYQAGGIEPRTWDDAARWVNMQTNGAVKEALLRSFGIDPDECEMTIAFHGRSGGIVNQLLCEGYRIFEIAVRHPDNPDETQILKLSDVNIRSARFDDLKEPGK